MSYFFSLLKKIMCIDVLSDVSRYHVCVVSGRPEHGVASPGAGVAGQCELPDECWELNPVLWKEQPVLVTAEPCLQP